jgi:hypothetical protein
MVTEYPVKLRVTLEPVGQPWVSVSAGGQKQVQQLDKTTDFDFEFVLRSGPCCLKVEHFKKDDNDRLTAVIVKEIGFFGISDPKFIWAGLYYPDYPLHYPDKSSPLHGQCYLGWNGVYQLEFSVPVFTWMHNTLDLGWIY